MSDTENPRVKVITAVDLRQAAAKFLLEQFQQLQYSGPQPGDALVQAAMQLVQQL